MNDLILRQEELIDKLRLIQNKDVRIAALENELRKANEQEKDFNRLSEEVRLNYPQISSMSYAESINKDFITQQVDTIAIYNIIFNDTTLTVPNRVEIKTRIGKWLSYRLQTEKLKVNEIKRSFTIPVESTNKETQIPSKPVE